MAYATWDACFVHLVELLVRSGAQLGTTNGFEETPLYIAGMGLNSKMVQCLLDRGALGDCSRFAGAEIPIRIYRRPI